MVDLVLGYWVELLVAWLVGSVRIQCLMRRLMGWFSEIRGEASVGSALAHAPALALALAPASSRTAGWL